MAAFDYTARDFSNIKNDLLRRASRVVPDWTSRDPSDFGMLLVDLWAQMGDVLHYYVDRAAAESFLLTAKQRESVLAYASLFDYTPSGVEASRGTVTLSNSTSSAITLPKYTSFIAQDGDSLFYFYTDTEVAISADSPGTEVAVTEGVRVEDETLTPSTGASGDNNQTYTLSYQNVPVSSITVNVYEDGTTPTLYRYVQKLVDIGPGERAFRVSYDADEYVQVVFGGSGQGIAPPSGTQIRSSYSYCSGALGNLKANSVLGFTASAPIGLTIVSSSSMVGGQFSEPITALRSRIPTSFRPQGRVVTQVDYVNAVRGIAEVAKVATAYTPGGSGNASVTVYPHVNRSADFLTTTDTSQTVSADTADAVLAELEGRRMMGVDVVVASSIDWTPIYLELTAYVSPTYYAFTVKDGIESKLKAFFDFNNIVFNQRISLGELYREVLSVPGLDYATITKFNLDDSSSVVEELTVGTYELPRIVLGSESSDTVIVTTSGGVEI